MYPEDAISTVSAHLADVQSEMNGFCGDVLKSRGGRMGSGMGALLEALWGYFANRKLTPLGLELARLEENQYNDFACLTLSAAWGSATREGELFRVEVKSMNVLAEESKGHFDELERNLGDRDQLLILLWTWDKIANANVSPKILDQFLDSAKGVAELRDALHIARGGTFVSRNQCPDKCPPEQCPHDGEPLNESGKRERKSGPASCRVSATTSYASNFGGLVRMLKTESENARKEFRRLRRTSNVADHYVSFIYRNFPAEESNQYLLDEWRKVGMHSGIDPAHINSLGKDELVSIIKEKYPAYQEYLRQL